MFRWGSLERRLFGWLLVLTLVPALVLLALATWIWSGSLDWVGTLGPWDRVAESGRTLFLAAERAAAEDAVLADALARHREELSTSLLLARRWTFLGERIGAALPVVAATLAAGLTALAFGASRRLARELARPIGELVGWAQRLGREERLPPVSGEEAREVREVRVLREALRRAADERAAARQRAIEAERIRVWGEMARRLAHEMKNPLTPLRLAAHRLAGAVHTDTGFEEPVSVIGEETSRLEELAQRFAALGRPPEGPTSPIDLVELLEGLLTTDVPATIERSLTADPELPLVEGHYDALLRAFRNLVRNAVEAVESSPGVEPPEPSSAPRIEVDLRVVGPAAVEVAVADTGRGLPDGVGSRIFEPDFTTKSRGSGLGLALVRQAVAAHGGEVHARTRPTGGGEFVVRLPAVGANGVRA